MKLLSLSQAAPVARRARTTSSRFEPEEFALERDQLLSWNGDQVGLIIRACEGTVWVTQKGDRRDIVLSRGERFRVTRPGRVVAQSLAAKARVAISA